MAGRPTDEYAGIGESDSDDGQHPGNFVRPPPPLQDPQDFEDYWSEELVILYHALIDRAAGNGWRVFESLDFCEFCKFAYEHSSREKEPWR